tara:strand:+ start:894 stop:1841 length:948 start_codon:yes stop_codon:yes gene_type:complete
MANKFDVKRSVEIPVHPEEAGVPRGTRAWDEMLSAWNSAWDRIPGDTAARRAWENPEGLRPWPHPGANLGMDATELPSSPEARRLHYWDLEADLYNYNNRGVPVSPPPSGAVGRYDAAMRSVNPSYRGSRAFHGTIPQATEAALRHPVLGKGMSRSARQAARMAAARGIGGSLPGVGPLVDYGLDTESRTPTQFLRSQEEAITGMVPGLVSPSELPPPAVLPPDRMAAVEATEGMVGVAPDALSGNVTKQEVRAYITNKVAKGEKLPAWADRITSMKDGRLSIKPKSPRTDARKKAAKRPHNPRMGPTKRKHGGY